MISCIVTSLQVKSWYSRLSSKNSPPISFVAVAPQLRHLYLMCLGLAVRSKLGLHERASVPPPPPVIIQLCPFATGALLCSFLQMSRQVSGFLKFTDIITYNVNKIIKLAMYFEKKTAGEWMPKGRLSSPITTVYEAARVIHHAMSLSQPSGSHPSAIEGFKNINQIVNDLVESGMNKEQALIAAVAGTMIGHGRQHEGFKVGDYVRGREGLYGIVVDEWKGQPLKRTSPNLYWVKVVPRTAQPSRNELRKRKGLPPTNLDRPWEYSSEDFPSIEDIPEEQLVMWDARTMQKVRYEFGTF